MNTKYIYWLGLLLYSTAVLYIGWRGFRRTKTSPKPDTEFWNAGRSLSGWSAGISISASFMSISWSCVYTVQLYYWYGLGALWLVPIPWLLTMAGYYFFTSHFRKLPAFSQPEMVANRFGQRARTFLALPLAFVFLVWGGAEIFAAAHVLSPLLELPFHLVLAFIAVVVASYSLMGGFSAVVITDRIQFALVAFFITAIAWISGSVILSETSISNWLTDLPSPPKVNSSALAFLAPGLPLIFLTLIAYLPGWLVESDIWLRLQASKNDSAARKAVVISFANSLLFLALLPMIIGFAALYLYPPEGTMIPANLNDGASIFSVFMQNHAPVWLSVILSIGLAAAAMSTIDTCGNVVALSLSYDLVEPILMKRKAIINQTTISRWMSAGAVGLAYLYALFTDSLWDMFYLSSGILTTTIFIPMLAVFSKSAKKSSVEASAATGFIATILFYFLESRGYLAALEPETLANTGLGYILWGLLAAGIAYGFGQRRGERD
ncbi:sodium:solute symporter family protein [candidate division KSB1 bacterium]|nr:sodium:solute symporter family protein [candidate division KSB1 bacterium]